MIEYTLGKTEQRIAQFVTKAREANNTHLVEQKQTDTNSEENRLNAYGAELAVCAVLNCYPDLTVHVRKGRPDLRIPGGFSADVKWSPRPNSDLIAYQEVAKHPSDIYILVNGSYPNYEIYGWAWGKNLLKRENIKVLREDRKPPYLLKREFVNEFFVQNLPQDWIKMIVDDKENEDRKDGTAV